MLLRLRFKSEGLDKMLDWLYQYSSWYSIQNQYSMPFYPHLRYSILPLDVSGYMIKCWIDCINLSAFHHIKFDLLAFQLQYNYTYATDRIFNKMISYATSTDFTILMFKVDQSTYPPFFFFWTILVVLIFLFHKMRPQNLELFKR